MSDVTAAFLVIGDEILSGRTTEKNMAVLAERLGTIGIQIKEMRVISDDVPVIIHHVNELRQNYSYLFTSGGLGPTHDDLTADAIAEAFGVALPLNIEADKLLSDYYRQRDIDYNENRRRMARIPQGGRLIPNPISIAPGFEIENVFVMAGVPQIFAAMVEESLPRLRQGAVLHSRMVSGLMPESEIATPLRLLAKDYPDLSIGCYPTWNQDKPMTSVVIRGVDVNRVEAAMQKITPLFPATLAAK